MIIFDYSDAIRWEQFKDWHFSRGNNFWTYDLILILKTSTRPYACLKKYYLFKTCLNVWFWSYMLMKSVSFRTVPIWLQHSVQEYREIYILKIWLYRLKHLPYYFEIFYLINSRKFQLFVSFSQYCLLESV